MPTIRVSQETYDRLGFIGDDDETGTGCDDTEIGVAFLFMDEHLGLMSELGDLLNIPREDPENFPDACPHPDEVRAAVRSLLAVVAASKVPEDPWEYDQAERAAIREEGCTASVWTRLRRPEV